MKNPWLVLILVVAVFFRFFHLTSSPPGLNWDEVSIGYNAYSILKTGRDEWGELMPVSFKAFGEHKLPGMIYASVPGIALFGTTDLGVRVTPALIGVLAVFMLYLLAQKLLDSAKLGIIAAGLMAVSPWAVHFSRVSFEAGLALLFTMASIFFLVKDKAGKDHLWLAMLFAVLAAYTYNSVRILLPLLFIVYLATKVIDWKKLSSRHLLPIIAVGVFLLSPVIIGLTRPEERVRWGTVSITSQKSFLDNIAESRGYTVLPNPLPRLIHNKVTHYVYELAYNYLHIFGSDFLFFKGGSNTQRSVQGMGLLYLFELPLLILGFSQLVKKSSRYTRAKQIILPWLLLAPVPSILTIDSPSTVRALALLPPLLLIESIGALYIFNWLKSRRALLTVSALFTLWCISYFAYQLWFVYPVKYADTWLYGYKQAILFAKNYYDEADAIYLPAKYGEPYIFTLFYTGYDPEKFQSIRSDRQIDPTGWVHNSGFDKYHFSDYSGLEVPKEIVARNHGKLVLITSFATLPAEFGRVLEIRAPNWKVMFEAAIVEGAL